MKEIVKNHELHCFGPEQGMLLNYIMFGALIATICAVCMLEAAGF